MTTNQLEIPTSSAITKILYKAESNSFDITFKSGTTNNFGAGDATNFAFCMDQFKTTQSVGKTYHSLINSGKLSINGSVV